MKNSIFLFSLIAFLMLQSCRCDDPSDPNCKNFDPCYEVQEPTADFDMSVGLCCELGGGNKTVKSYVFDDDKLYFYGNVFLEAKYDDATSYKWKIGFESEYREGKEVTVFFDYPWGKVDITLMVEYEVNDECHLNKTGTDTLKKSIELVTREDLPFWGTFRGYKEGAPDELMDIEMDFMQYTVYGGNPFQIDSAYILRDFIYNPCNITFWGAAIGSREMLFSGSDIKGSACENDLAFGILTFTDNFDKLTIKYQEFESHPDPNVLSKIPGAFKYFHATRTN